MNARAITIRQPWASLVAVGAKTIIDQAKPTDWRGPLLIHAGQRPPDHGLRLGPQTSVVAQEFLVSYPPVPSNRSRAVLLDLCNEETIPLPLGAVVASCVLADCVPIVAGHPPLAPDASSSVPVVEVWGGRLAYYTAEAPFSTDVTDQLPFGDFSPGRHAWLLEDVKATSERCPRCWGDGVWPVGGAPDYNGEPVYEDCEVCDRQGVCPPVPMRGHQGVWTPDWKAT